MNYFSSKNHVSWCCFLFKCKLTQKNSFILSFEQKASDFLKGRGKEKGKEKAEGKEKAGRERESRKEERESDAAELHRTQPHGRQKAKREGGGGKEKEESKDGNHGTPRPRLLDEAMVYRRLLMPAIDYSQILITLKNRLPSK